MRPLSDFRISLDFLHLSEADLEAYLDRLRRRQCADAPTALYRAFDAAGALLYVGITRNWGRRWAQHSERSEYFDDVTRLEIEWFSFRAAAEEAETRAIQSEGPKYNQRKTRDAS